MTTVNNDSNNTFPASMRAVRIHEYGDAQVLNIDKIALPSITDDQVLVHVHAAAINPVDWKIRQGFLEGMLGRQLPLTLGWDVAGEIVAIGANVSEWRVGDAIYSRPNISLNGAYADYISIDQHEVAAKPATLNWEQAAAVPLAALTAWQVLHEAAQIKANEKVFIQAGAGGVGAFAIQLAKAAGAYVVTSCSTRNVDFVKSLGADEVIDYTQQNVADLEDMDVVFDTLGGDALAQSWGVLKAGGRLVSIVATPDEAIAKQHDVSAHFVFVQPSAEQLNAIAALIDDNKLSVVIDTIYALEQIKEAHALSETGRARGKIVLSMKG